MVGLELSKLLNKRPDLNIKLEWENHVKLKDLRYVINDLRSRNNQIVTNSMVSGLENVLKKLKTQIDLQRPKFGIFSQVKNIFFENVLSSDILFCILYF